MYYKLDKNGVDFKKITTTQIIGRLILLCLFLGIVIWWMTPSSIYNVEKIPIKILNQQEIFSPKKLQFKIKELNLEHPEIVYAQALLESSNFQSNIFRSSNNLFGMKEARQRPTTASGTENSHAYYNNWVSSVIDYALWQSAYGRHLTNKQYLDLLSNIYAQDSSYIDKINKILNQNQ